jgi:tryptophan 7-halogenase
VSGAIQRVVIAGGTPVAWLAAAALRRAFRHRDLHVTVIDSGGGKDAPAGRWTLPSQRGMHGLVGINERDLMRRTGATFKLASEHLGWHGAGSGFLHAHGDIGSDLGATPFYKYLLLQAITGRPENPEHYSLAAVAARLGRFARPMGSDAELTSSFTYAFHLDESSYIAYLREHAARLGVHRIAGDIVDVARAESGNLDALTVASGERIAGDYFIDCTGADAPVMNKIARGGRDDWTPWLPCDRMISALTPPLADAAPLTRITATDAGWLWRAPLAQAALAGYVFSSAHLEERAALVQLEQSVPGLQVSALNRFASGRRQKFWERNCIALGTAAVELEPLAGADLHLALLGIGTLLELFPLDTHSQVESVEYNRIMGEHADALRDFTIAHYRAGRARPGEFWDATRSVPPPPSLAAKLDLYSANGRIVLADHESFEETDWAWLLMGAGRYPDSIEAQIQTRLEKITLAELAPLRARIQQLAASMPPHIEYVRRQSEQAQHAKS